MPANQSLMASVAAAAVLQLLSTSYTDEAVGSGTATASFSLNSGNPTAGASGGVTDENGFGAYSWLSGGQSANYEVRVTLSAGSFSSGPAADSWWGLDVGRSWTVTRSVLGTKSASFGVEIRAAGGGPTLVSASISLSATRS